MQLLLTIAAAGDFSVPPPPMATKSCPEAGFIARHLDSRAPAGATPSNRSSSHGTSCKTHC
jgi:hypothetical protein